MRHATHCVVLVLWISPNIGYRAGVGHEGEVGRRPRGPRQGPGVRQGHQLRGVGGPSRDYRGSTTHPEYN